MDREKAIEYIGHVSWRHSRLGLARMEELMDRLGSPQNSLRFVHVAGTNGKGSVCAMLSSVLTAAGYTAGLYTSPFINRFNERIQICGAPIEDGELAALTEELRVHADAMEDHPTEFELITALAFVYFHRRKCDIVVLEVGLGGRLDATNIIPPPELAVITTIALDHTDVLGDTAEKIAAEKAGVIKKGADVVLYPQTEGVRDVFVHACAAAGARLHDVDMAQLSLLHDGVFGLKFSFGAFGSLAVPLAGEYQLRNAATALTAVSVLRQRRVSISDGAVRRGLAAVKWPARFEVVSREPMFIVDGGHNPECVQALVQSLTRYFPGQRFVFLVGAMADKDYERMFGLVVPLALRMYCVTPENPRALPAEELAETLCRIGARHAQACPGVQSGVLAARGAIPRGGVGVAFGSFYMAGVIRACFGLN